MHSLIIIAAALAQQQEPGSDPTQESIVVTGSREPVAASEAPVSATIFEAREMEALGVPLAADILRLAPGVSVAASGPKGTQTQLRIRGAEANHTLLFVDGIRFNDPAAGNEARFELLTTDALSRLEVVRGPQSALWGSEALGGVVAIETADPLKNSGLAAQAEYGSLDTKRLSGQFAERIGPIGLSGSGGWIASAGIDSFGDGGERDGFENRAASLKAVANPLPSTEIGIVGHWIEGESDFDGFDPVTFRRADTLDATENRLRALRGWGSVDWSGWSLLIDASLLGSRNRNFLGDEPLNSTFGERFTLGGQVSKQAAGHRFTGAVEHEKEDFRAEDQVYFGATDQERSRSLTAVVGEWRAEWTPQFGTGLAVRHDDFSAFEGATTLRASAIFKPAPHWTIHAAYGEGIAQPTFYDLYGFFPGSFAGNPNIKPEKSKGWELGFRWSDSRSAIGVTGFTHRLEQEIVDIFDPVTFLSSTANVEGKSRRWGVELEARHAFSPLAQLTFNYTYLDADERQAPGDAALREIRRPRHSANAMLTGSLGPLSWGASLSYVGKRSDTDFDLFPAGKVVLDDYLLGSARIGYRLSPALQAYARVENALDADYQDVVGYHTPGSTVHAGLRVRLGD